MKIVTIGDIHGKNIWRSIVDENMDADKIIFIGDYFDSFDVPFEEQAKNFNEILDLKISNPDRIVLLIGNHDYQYISDSERYSGYQSQYSEIIADVIGDAINSGLIRMCHYEKSGDVDFLFTHAGITNTWAREHMIEPYNKPWRDLNAMLKNKPEAFVFKPSNPLDNNGDSITQPPIWVRPRALLSDKFGNDEYVFEQVVGHTRHKHIETINGVTFIDALDYGTEYLVIQDGIKTIQTIHGNKKEIQN